MRKEQAGKRQFVWGVNHNLSSCVNNNLHWCANHSVPLCKSHVNCPHIPLPQSSSPGSLCPTWSSELSSLNPLARYQHVSVPKDKYLHSFLYQLLPGQLRQGQRGRAFRVPRGPPRRRPRGPLLPPRHRPLHLAGPHRGGGPRHLLPQGCHHRGDLHRQELWPGMARTRLDG